MTTELRWTRARFNWGALALAAFALSARAQDGEDEDAFTPRIGIHVATHEVRGATFVCRGEIGVRRDGSSAAFRDATDMGPFTVSSPTTGVLWSYRGRDVAAQRIEERVGATGVTVERPTGIVQLTHGPGELRSNYVADSALRELLTVLDWDSPTTELLSHGYASDTGRLRNPQGLAAAPDALYVADQGAHRVQKFSSSGSPLAQVGSRGTAEGQFIRPTDVAVDSAGFVYVVDTGNHRVQKFDGDLHFVKSWGAFGPHPGFFAFPEGIDCFENTLYVVDTDNHRVQVFDLDGGLKYEWGLHALLPREGGGKLHYPADVSVARTPDGLVAVVTEPFEDRFQVFRETKPGEGLPPRVIPDRTIAAHFGPRLDIAEDLAVLFEPGAPSILMYDLEHEVEPWEPVQTCRLSNWGARIGQFRCPTDVAIDSKRRVVYVADADTGRLASYRYAHTRETPLQYNPFEFQLVQSLDLAEHRRLATPEREFEIEPDALELHPSGDVYVLDSLQNEVFVFSPRLELRRTLSFGAAATPPSRFVDLAFSPDGATLYVLDETWARIVVADIREAASPEERLASPRVPWFAVSRSSFVPGSKQVVVSDPTWLDGAPRREPGRPGGLAVAPNGDLYVSDTTTDSIRRFSSNFTPLAEFGAPGIGRVEFHKPRGLDFDEQGRLYVVDWGNHRVQVLTPEGEFIAAFGSRLFTKSTLPSAK